MSGGMTAPKLGLEGPWTDRAASGRALDAFASDLLGIVTETIELTYSDDDLPSFYVGTNVVEAVELIGSHSNAENGGGDFHRGAARAAAIGETVERYSAAYVDPRLLRFASYDELAAAGEQVVDPSAMALFAPDQYAQPGFGFTPFRRSTQTHWIDGVDLLTGSHCWVPAQLVYLSGTGMRDAERIGYSTSNGLACGPTRREALAAALLELVERDAVMLAWYGSLSLPRIDLTSDAMLAARVQRSFRRTRLEFDAVDLTGVLGVPTALGVVRNLHSDVAALSLGAASSHDLALAAESAITEAFQTRTWCKLEQDGRPRIPDEARLAEQVTDFADHIRYYAERDRASRAAFLWASSERVDLSSSPTLPASTPADLIDALCAKVKEAGANVYAVDVTSPDVAEAGFSVVKALSPQLQPLDAGWSTRFLGGDRIRRVPAVLRGQQDPLTDEQLNHWPHPFP